MANKKLNTLPSTSALNNEQVILCNPTSGQASRIGLSGLRASVLNNLTLDALTSCVGVAYRRDSYPQYCSLSAWSALASTNTADGIALIIPGYGVMVIALEEAASQLAPGNANTGRPRLAVLDAQADMDGYGNTDAAKSVSGLNPNVTSSAFGYVLHYSTANIGAGKWWLPSLGEALMIKAYRHIIDYALSIVGGTPLSSVLMTSTQGPNSGTYYICGMSTNTASAPIGGVGARNVRAITKLQ